MSKANPWHSTLSIQPFRIAGTLNQYSGNWGWNNKQNLSQDSYFSPTDLSSQDIQQAKVGHNMGTVG